MEIILIIYLIGIVFTFGYWVGNLSYIEIRWWHAFIWVVILVIWTRSLILDKWEAFYRSKSVELARVLLFNHKIRASEDYTNEYYNRLRSQKIIKEECDHHWITDVQLGDYVECELCGLIFPKTELKKLRYNEKEF